MQHCFNSANAGKFLAFCRERESKIQEENAPPCVLYVSKSSAPGNSGDFWSTLAVGREAELAASSTGRWTLAATGTVTAQSSSPPPWEAYGPPSLASLSHRKSNTPLLCLVLPPRLCTQPPDRLQATKKARGYKQGGEPKGTSRTGRTRRRGTRRRGARSRGTCGGKGDSCRWGGHRASSLTEGSRSLFHSSTAV